MDEEYNERRWSTGMAGEEEQETPQECDVQYMDMQHI